MQEVQDEKKDSDLATIRASLHGVARHKDIDACSENVERSPHTPAVWNLGGPEATAEKCSAMQTFDGK